MRLLFILLVIGFISNSNHAQSGIKKFEYERPIMGTSFRIILYAPSQTLADLSAESAFNKVEELNQIFSNYVEDSEVSLLAQRAIQKPFQVSNDLWEVMQKAEELKHNSDGVFDISIGNLTKLWRRAIRRQVMPDHDLIREFAASHHRLITMDKSDQLVQLSQEVLLDLGAIAKGYAVDEAYKVLLETGIPIALIDGGGDIYAGQAPEGETGWTIGIEGMEETLVIENEAVASSGSTFKYINHDGRKYSHIIDPRSGYGVINPKLSVVKAPSCMMADASASILSILQEGHKRKDFVSKYPGLTVIL